MCRIAAICTTKLDLLSALLPSLSPNGSSVDRRQALLLINNLCIPMENKAVIMLGEPCDTLLPALLTTIRSRVPECYLAIVCLFNLSLLVESKPILLRYVPPASLESDCSETFFENSTSLLRTIESLTKGYLPFVTKLEKSSDILSVQREAVRWSFCLMRHLSTLAENAVVVANKTIFPFAAIQCIEVSLQTGKDLGFWRQDSLEASSLMILVHLAQHGEECISPWRSETVMPVLRRLKGKGGIHESRAVTLLQILEQPLAQIICTADSEIKEEKKEWV